MTIPLNANVIILHGPNGVGKTSLLDAVLWVLSGRIDRFGTSGGPVSLYAKEGIARVELVIHSSERAIVVTRSSDGKKDQVRLLDGEESLEGAAAETRLISAVLPHLVERNDPAQAMGKILTRGVY